MKLTPSRLFGRFTRRSVRPTCLTAQRLLFAKVTLPPPFIPPIGFSRRVGADETGNTTEYRRNDKFAFGFSDKFSH